MLHKNLPPQAISVKWFLLSVLLNFSSSLFAQTERVSQYDISQWVNSRLGTCNCQVTIENMGLPTFGQVEVQMCGDVIPDEVCPQGGNKASIPFDLSNPSPQGTNISVLDPFGSLDFSLVHPGALGRGITLKVSIVCGNGSPSAFFLTKSQPVNVPFQNCNPVIPCPEVSIDYSINVPQSEVVANVSGGFGNYEYSWVLRKVGTTTIITSSGSNSVTVPCGVWNVAVTVESDCDACSYTYTQTVGITACGPKDDGGRLSQATTKKLSLYPNPAKESFILRIGSTEIVDKEIQILDTSGRLIRRVELNPMQNQVKVNTQELSNGIYLVQLRSGTSIIATEKIVVEK